jgi:hypothetical protein
MTDDISFKAAWRGFHMMISHKRAVRSRSQGACQSAHHAVRATRAETDETLLKSWVRSLNSTHCQRNFAVTALALSGRAPRRRSAGRYRRGRA